MKKSLYILFFSFLFLFCFSCTDNEKFENRFGYVKAIKLSMASVDRDSMEDDQESSRATLTGNTSSWSIYFDNGVDTVDTMGLFPTGGYQIPFKLPIPVGTTANNVVIKAEGWATKKNTTYAVYLPFKYDNRDYTRIPWDLRRIPTQKSITDKATASKMMLYATDTVQATGDTINARMYMKGCILQIRCQFPSINPTFVRIMLASNDPNQFTVYGTLNLFDSYPSTPADYSARGADQKLTSIETSDHLIVNLQNIQKNASNNYLITFFAMPPVDFSGKTIAVYVWDSSGNIYTDTKFFAVSSSSVIPRHKFVNYNFTNMQLYTGPIPSLKPWEKEEDLCPTCTPVAF